MWQGQFCKLGHILASGRGTPLLERGVIVRVGGQWMSLLWPHPTLSCCPRAQVLRTNLGDGAFGW